MSVSDLNDVRPLMVTSPEFLIDDAGLGDLSPREVDVLRLITNCYSNQEISETHYLSLNSVKTYIRGAYRRIGAPTRSHAVIWGVLHGLLEETPRSQHLGSRLGTAI